MDEVKEAEVIRFPKPQPKAKSINKCSFCQKPLVKGKFIQAAETEPAICFGCVSICSTLLGE